MTEQQLPEGWQMVKFGDIAKHISIRVEPSETDLEIYVGLEHLDSDSLKIKRHGVPSDVEGQKLLVKKGQIIFCKRRAYQRKVAVANWDCICSTDAMILEANPDNVIPEFLPFFMQSDLFVNRVIAHSEGSLSPRIKWKTLENQFFQIPNTEEQEKLVKLFNKINCVSALLDSLSSAIPKDDLFLQTINQDENKIEIGLLSDIVTSGSTPKGGSKNYLDSGIPFIRSQNIYPNEIVWSDIAFISDEMHREMSRSSLQDGDVLLNITGASIGRCAVFRGDKQANVNQHVCIIRCKKDMVKPEFLCAYLNSKYGQVQINRLQGGLSREALNFSQVRSILIPKLNLVEQEKMSNTLMYLNSIGKEVKNKSNLLKLFLRGLYNNKV
ncbi:MULTISPECIES: restriction endonuclease subunit S [Enterobacterales]|uniref:restriction endonuclease subunit S n=1 Tax=Hafnia paralvei TaxID=546367 RepID=UPI001034B28F|nr:restriction endonuclease subunit S [Hafnia paralvei]TBM21949.1 restriction endonuclease subunit S [Hafnia paralvei]